MEKATLRSPNIDCSHCIENIRYKVGRMYGVGDVEGDPAKKEVRITYDPAIVKLDALKEAMADAGYPIAA